MHQAKVVISNLGPDPITIHDPTGDTCVGAGGNHTRSVLEVAALHLGVGRSILDGAETIARVAHEVNRAYCAALGDDSQLAWDDAPQWQRDSAVAGVRFHLANPGAGPQASHESWLAVKDQDGWVYGPVKDPAKKEHPCMVPFKELPVEQQAKDFLFRAIVHNLAPIV